MLNSFVPKFPLFSQLASLFPFCLSWLLLFMPPPPCLGNEPTALHLSLIFPCVLDMTDEWGPPELCSPGLQIKAAPTARWSINQFTPQAADQPINQSLSQQMLLLSLSRGARSGVVEVVFPTKARGWKCLGIEWEADFHVSSNLSSFL